MFTANKYDAPVAAMVKALNDNINQEVDISDIRDSWYFHLGDEKDNKFSYWLDKTMELVNNNVKIIYKKTPGWYTGVKLLVTREIKDDELLQYLQKG